MTPQTQHCEKCDQEVTIDHVCPVNKHEGVKAKIRSCKSCIHAPVCKIFEFQAIAAKNLEELAKRSNVELDITPPEEIGAKCSVFKSDTYKEVK